MLRQILCVMLLVPTLALANTTASANFTAKLGEFTSMKANFKQVVKDAKGQALQRSSGNMILSRPGKFRWYTHQPNRQIIVVLDDKMWIYDIDLEQMTIDRLNQTDESVPAMLLSDTTPDINNAFIVTEEKSKHENDQWFKLVPKNKENNFVWIKFHFKGDKLDIMKFKDKLDQVTEVTFKNIKLDLTIKTGAFKIKPQKGVDVIDNYQTEQKLS